MSEAIANDESELHLVLDFSAATWDLHTVDNIKMNLGSGINMSDNILMLSGRWRCRKKVALEIWQVQLALRSLILLRDLYKQQQILKHEKIKKSNKAYT